MGSFVSAKPSLKITWRGGDSKICSHSLSLSLSTSRPDKQSSPPIHFQKDKRSCQGLEEYKTSRAAAAASSLAEQKAWKTKGTSQPASQAVTFWILPLRLLSHYATSRLLSPSFLPSLTLHPPRLWRCVHVMFLTTTEEWLKREQNELL